MAKMVTIDLTTGKITTDAVDSELEKKFIGGWGISCALAYDLIKPGIDPYAPENPIIISTGPFNGTSVPSAKVWPEKVISRSRVLSPWKSNLNVEAWTFTHRPNRTKPLYS